VLVVQRLDNALKHLGREVNAHGLTLFVDAADFKAGEVRAGKPTHVVVRVLYYSNETVSHVCSPMFPSGSPVNLPNRKQVASVASLRLSRTS
jgi:hypothetical protein